jgi:aspartate/methionine/tyrosine aminotransferase
MTFDAKIILSQRSRRIDASGIRRIWNMAQSMSDPVDFSIGQPDFSVPQPIKSAAIEAIADDFNGYSLTGGITELREAIVQQVQDEFGWDSPSILVTSGLSGALHVAFMTLVDPGDEVLIPDPYFVSYSHLINLVDGRCVFIDTYPDFQLRPEALEAAITDRSKILIINSPCNPTGAVFDSDQLQAIAEVARKHELLILSDEIYQEFSYDQPSPSIAQFYENTLVLRGFSKSYGLPGWRLGYVAAAAGLSGVIEQMATLQQYTFVCAPQPFQKAAITALQVDMSEEVNHYRRKRDMIYHGLKDHFELIQPAGAFYAFVAAPGGEATKFVERAIENNVLIIQGSVFSQRDSHFRISYATSDSQIEKGIDRLCKLVKK